MQAVQVSISGKFTPPVADAKNNMPQNVYDFITKFYPYAVMASAMTGLPVSYELAQAADETGWGKHAPGNNFFGMKWSSADKNNPYVTGSQLLRTTECKKVNGRDITYHTWAEFKKYADPWGSFIDHALYLKKYPDLFTKEALSNPHVFAEELHKNGYATDFKYGVKIDELIRDIQWHLRQMGLKDFNFADQNQLNSTEQAQSYLSSNCGITVNVKGETTVQPSTEFGAYSITAEANPMSAMPSLFNSNNSLQTSQPQQSGGGINSLLQDVKNLFSSFTDLWNDSNSTQPASQPEQYQPVVPAL